MKRTSRVSFTRTKKTKPARARERSRRPNLKQIEDQLAVLLLLLQHNIDKLLRHERSMSNKATDLSTRK